ncbi:MAG: 4Fe-4S binding protein, partial [Sulfolobales archaeon]|nr:4Fe-4S binding protein [Sulfolobales archaeon]
MKYLDLIRVALRTGRVTRRYPREEPLLTEAFRGFVEIDPERCWGCGACALACPSNALRVEVDGGSVRLQYFLGRCVQCGKCFE